MTINKLFLSLFIFISFSSLLYATDEQDIEKCFNRYKEALATGDGDSAARLVSAKTIVTYQEYKKNALSASSMETKKLSPINKLMVLLIRAQMPVEELERTSGSGVFSYAVKSGWVSKNLVVNSTINNIVISENTATSFLNTEGRPPLKGFTFLKENNLWKLDLVTIILKTEEAYKGLIAKQNTTEDQFIFTLVEGLTHKKLTDDIWRPLRR
jgi:hypothetical protein